MLNECWAIRILDNNGQNITYVSSVEFAISEEYINNTYDSCKGIGIPSTGGVAMDLACGIYNSITCSGKRYA